MTKSISLTLFAAAFVTTGMMTVPETATPAWKIPVAMISAATAIAPTAHQDVEPAAVVALRAR